jgi:divalent metal cation (Fe/Co/Zn/Cd) transporter
MQEQNFTDSFEQNSKPDLVIPRTSLYLLMETAKWGKFLSIVGFVFVGIALIMAFGFGYIFNQVQSELTQNTPVPMGPMVTGVYLLVAALYFFPCLYLYRYSQKIKAAVRERDQIQLTEALANQKSLYKFMGILTIVGLGFYAFALLFVLAGAMIS